MKNRNITLLLWLVLFIWLASCTALRHPTPKGRTITSLSIRHTTPKLVQDLRISQLISSQPGSIYSEEKLYDDIKSLYESGLIEGGRFSVQTDTNSVHLVASVSTRRGSGPVLLIGNSAFSDLTLWKQISEPLAKRINRAVTVVYDPVTDEPIAYRDKRLVEEVLPAVCAELERFYRSKGFRDVSVRTESWKGGSASATDFVFVIDEHFRE